MKAVVRNTSQHSVTTIDQLREDLFQIDQIGSGFFFLVILKVIAIERRRSIATTFLRYLEENKLEQNHTGEREERKRPVMMNDFVLLPSMLVYFPNEEENDCFSNGRLD